MYFESIAAAMEMDGHGAYVWSAYLISIVVLTYLIWSPFRRRRSLEVQVRGELRRAESGVERSRI